MDPLLCLGKVGVCACASPATTPRLGLVKCDVNDVTCATLVVLCSKQDPLLRGRRGPHLERGGDVRG